MSDTTTPVSTRLNNEEVAKLERLAAVAGVSRAMALRLLVQAVDELQAPAIIQTPAKATWKGKRNE